MGHSIRIVSHVDGGYTILVYPARGGEHIREYYGKSLDEAVGYYNEWLSNKDSP